MVSVHKSLLYTTSAGGASRDLRRSSAPAGGRSVGRSVVGGNARAQRRRNSGRLLQHPAAVTVDDGLHAINIARSRLAAAVAAPPDHRRPTTASAGCAEPKRQRQHHRRRDCPSSVQTTPSKFRPRFAPLVTGTTTFYTDRGGRTARHSRIRANITQYGGVYYHKLLRPLLLTTITAITIITTSSAPFVSAVVSRATRHLYTRPISGIAQFVRGREKRVEFYRAFRPRSRRRGGSSIIVIVIIGSVVWEPRASSSTCPATPSAFGRPAKNGPYDSAEVFIIFIGEYRVANNVRVILTRYVGSILIYIYICIQYT